MTLSIKPQRSMRAAVWHGATIYASGRSAADFAACWLGADPGAMVRDLRVRFA